MKKHTKKLTGRVRAYGFTLVEILIVTVIIGIMAGMMMIMMGRATDGAIAIRLVNDLRLVKSASLGYFMDNGYFPGDKLPTGGHESLAKSLEPYFDRPFLNDYGGKIHISRSNDQTFYGLLPEISKNAFTGGVLMKLEKLGVVYDSDGNQFKYGDGTYYGPFYMVIKKSK
jgi:prepilin-type N-terminal cleavage/methylation domain-containing protein